MIPTEEWSILHILIVPFGLSVVIALKHLYLLNHGLHGSSAEGMRLKHLQKISCGMRGNL